MYGPQIEEKSEVKTSSGLGTFLAGVYYWMCFALCLSGLCAWLVGTSPELSKAIVGNKIVMFMLILIEFGLVIGISAAIRKLSSSVATALFAAYAAVSGLTLSVIFLVYDLDTIGSAFFSTALMFGAVAVYGSVTKRDLSKLGSILFMALLGLVIATLVNIFLRNEILYWIVTYAGVLIFTGLTAYDAQKAKHMYELTAYSSEDRKKGMILCALELYLDFINLFLYLLRILSGRKN